MTDLITRLSKLDAPDPYIDVLIENALGLAQFKRVECGHGDSDYVRHNVQPYTASVDAAIALAERVLPGWKWYAGNWNVHAAVLSPDRNNDQRAVGATPAIALCIAILRAKEASNA